MLLLTSGNTLVPTTTSTSSSAVVVTTSGGQLVTTPSEAQPTVKVNIPISPTTTPFFPSLPPSFDFDTLPESAKQTIMQVQNVYFSGRTGGTETSRLLKNVMAQLKDRPTVAQCAEVIKTMQDDFGKQHEQIYQELQKNFDVLKASLLGALAHMVQGQADTESRLAQVIQDTMTTESQVEDFRCTRFSTNVLTT